jgi:uncharacterized protein
MRTSNVIVSVGLIGLAFGFSPAASFDGTRTPETAPVVAPLPGDGVAPLGAVSVGSQQGAPSGPTLSAVPPAAATPYDALRSGNQMLREGRIGQGLLALEYAAERGVPGAIWKLGRMYADGDGVRIDEKRAFEYFRSLTKAHGYDPPGTPHARFVANAFVALGYFYLKGIRDADIKSDPVVAHGMFRHAATYFGDPEAQYQIGRMYLEGAGTPKDAVQASRWLRVGADGGQRNAQALLGAMLFKGTGVSRQAAMGLFWLTVAKDAVTKEGGGPDDKWITDTYSSAFAQATEDERVMAHGYLEGWLGKRR